MQSKIYALILSSLMALTFVIGCESANSSNDTRKNFKNISLALDWYPWSNHVGLFVAKEKGTLRTLYSNATNKKFYIHQ